MGWKVAFAAWTLAICAMFNVYSTTRMREVEGRHRLAALARLQESNVQLQRKMDEVWAAARPAAPLAAVGGEGAAAPAPYTQELQPSLQGRAAAAALPGHLQQAMTMAAATPVPVRGLRATLDLDEGWAEATTNEQLARRSRLRRPLLSNHQRKLAGLLSVVSTNTGTSGCLSLTGSASVQLAPNSGACMDSNRCPTCFIFSSLTSNKNIILIQCSNTQIGSVALSNQAVEMLFINTDASNTVKIYCSPNTAGFGFTGYYKTVNPQTYGVGTCYSDGTHMMHFQDPTGAAPR